MTRYDHIDFTPPQGVRDACLRGVALHEGGVTGDGIEPETVEWARKLARGVAITPSKARKMARFFGRNQRFAAEPKDSPAWASWQLWGGHAGDAWSEKLVTQMDAADEAQKMTDGIPTPANANDSTANDDAIVSVVDASEATHMLPVFPYTDAMLSETAPHAIPYAAHPIHEAAWDADSAVARLRKLAGVDAENPPASAWSKYAEGFAIVRGPRDNLTSYVLPHHDVIDGRLVTVPAGVSAAIGALNGARGGGVDVPDSVRDAALNHLERHRVEAQKSDESEGETKASTLRGEPLAIEFADGGEASVGHSTWNQIARVGVFKGHPQGAVEFTPQVFDEIIANFRATKNGEVPGDYEHTSERLPPTVATDGVPAPFWVTDVAKRNGDRELWAKFSWVDPQAVKYVRSKRYRYVSPAVNFNARSRETGLPIGARLTSVALTNHPFLDGMMPIAASANAGDHIATDALCAWLSLPSNATTEDIVKALSTRFSPSPDSTHAPTFGAPENARMEPEKKMADAPPPVADAAAPAAKPEADKDFGGKYRTLAARMAQCMSMEGFDPEAECAEDALIEQMTKIIGNLAEHQKREEAANMAAAATMADRVIAAGLAESGAKDALTTLCLSQRATFDVLYPAAKIAAAEGSKTMSARSTVTRDAATILTQSVGAAGGAMHGTAGAATVGAEAPESHRLHNRAVAIMGERKVDLFTARKIAETEAATAAR